MKGSPPIRLIESKLVKDSHTPRIKITLGKQQDISISQFQAASEPGTLQKENIQMYGNEEQQYCQPTPTLYQQRPFGFIQSYPVSEMTIKYPSATTDTRKKAKIEITKLSRAGHKQIQGSAYSKEQQSSGYSQPNRYETAVMGSSQVYRFEQNEPRRYT